MPKWEEVLKTGVLEKVGGKCLNTRSFAEELSKELGEPVSVDALFNAHKRHRSRLSLKESLTAYLAEAEDVGKAATLGLYDIKWRLSKEKLRRVKKAKRLIITSAMNNCKVNQDFWKSLNSYAKHNKAEVIIIPLRYRNPTNPNETKNNDAEYWWQHDLWDCLTDDPIKLHSNLWVLSQVRIQATASNPLSGLDEFSSGSSAIFGHSQLAMKTVPTPQHSVPKVIYTTGSCVEANYSATKAGIRGAFNHTQAAVIVELEGSKYFLRNISADSTGGFYDLDKYYHPKGVRSGNRALAIVTGDEHAMFNDSKNRAATYTDKNSIVNVLKPEKIVRHDVFDGYSISHHNRNDPVIQYGKHKYGHHLVKDELELTLKHIEDTTPKFSENVIVASNHHDHLLRWLKESHPAKEPWNADIWLEIWGLIKETIEFKERGLVYSDPFALWMSKRIKTVTKFLERDTDEAIGGILVGFHGDEGANGSRGSIRQYGKIGSRTVIGHSHSPGIYRGAFQVGTSSTLRMDYTRGPSSWSHCHCIIYPNGKRQQIFVIDGKWRRTSK